ncbi:MAG TPA: hypothetical protein ENI49_04520 [Thermoplasmatales archaeon]|nr:hypothetical protein [Thermoplasmatales archaeon]
MRKLTSYLVLLTLLGSMLLTGCINNQNFEIHEWGVFVKGYECNETSVLTNPPELTFVYKPVIYFHSLENSTNVEVEIDFIKNVTAIPNATINDNKIIWNVTVENDSIKMADEETYYDYLFYEGEIIFSPHVTVMVTDEWSNVTYYVKNNESFTISNVFCVYGKCNDFTTTEDDWLECVYFGDLQPGEGKTVNDTDSGNIFNVTEAIDTLYDALISYGLTRDETQMLLNYWKDWWFYPTNLGNYTRVIYTIPQSIYDQLLPITVTPKPSSIVRVGIVTITDIPVLDLSNLSLTILTDRASYRVNDGINISLSITNRGDKDINLTFPDAQVADFEIVSGEGKQVYLWSSGRMFAQVITTLKVPAGESIELLNETWRADAREGNYTIVGWLPTTPKVYSNPITINIS